jgi:hypothetical protein
VFVNDQGNSPGPALGASQSTTLDILPVDDPPTLSMNRGITITAAVAAVLPITRVITTADLSATDIDSGPGQIVYTVATTPTVGAMRTGVVSLQPCPAPTSSFTQLQLLDGQVNYLLNSPTRPLDLSMTFRLANVALCSGPAPTSFPIRVRAP